MRKARTSRKKQPPNSLDIREMKKPAGVIRRVFVLEGAE
jgi:hypothetical protein